MLCHVDRVGPRLRPMANIHRPRGCPCSEKAEQTLSQFSANAHGLLKTAPGVHHILHRQAARLADSGVRARAIILQTRPQDNPTLRVPCGVDGTGTAGGYRMQTVIDPGEVARVATRGRGEAAPLRLTTTLYALMAALQAVATPHDDALVVATVTHLLRSRRLTWLRTDHMRRGPSRRQIRPPRPGPRAPCIAVPAAQDGSDEDPPNMRRGAWAGSASQQVYRGYEAPTVSDRRSDLCVEPTAVPCAYRAP
jgi:hypothetical protein